MAVELHVLAAKGRVLLAQFADVEGADARVTAGWSLSPEQAAVLARRVKAAAEEALGQRYAPPVTPEGALEAEAEAEGGGT